MQPVASRPYSGKWLQGTFLICLFAKLILVKYQVMNDIDQYICQEDEEHCV